MAIYRILQNTAFDPAMVKLMTEAYEDACRVLLLKDRRSDPITELLALKIIEVTQTGVKSPSEIRRIAFDELGISQS